MLKYIRKLYYYIQNYNFTHKIVFTKNSIDKNKMTAT